MPIEILPEGLGAWIEPSTKAGIKFLGLDPFWKVKTGKTSPSYAILYRGGYGFLEQSTDGGQTWHSILPGDTPAWYGSQWYLETWGANYGEVPVPNPRANGEPIGAPSPYEITYASYAPNWANSSEHYVLCSYNGPSELGAGWDLNALWILYTVDDWASHDWFPVVDQNISFNYAPVSNGGDTTLQSSASTTGFDATMIRVSPTKVAAFWKNDATGEHGHMLTESGGTFTDQGDTSDYWIEPMYFDGTYVWCGEIWRYDDAGGVGVDRYKARAYRWDFSGSGAPSVTYFESDWLPDFSGTSENTYRLESGTAWHFTEGGRLCFCWGCYRLDTVDDRMWHMLYYDSDTDTWSTPYELYNTTEDLAPEQITISAATIDGGERMVVNYVERWDYTGRPDGPDTYGWYYIQDAGAWGTKYDEYQYMSHEDDATVYDVNSQSTKLLSNNRIVIQRAGIFEYDLTGGTPTLTELVNTTSNLDWFSGRIVGYSRDCDLEDWWAYSEKLYRSAPSSEPEGYPNFFIQWSDTLANVYCSLVDFTTYGRIWQDGGTGDVIVDIATVSERPSDWISGRAYAGRMSCSYDGNYLHVPYWRYNTSTSYFICKVDQMVRNVSTGEIEYTADGYPEYVTLGNDDPIANVGNAIVSCAPNPDDTDGVLILGLPTVGDSTYQAGLYGFSESGGWTYYWWHDPELWVVRAVASLSGVVFAIIDKGTALELWKETTTTPGAMITKVSDISYITDVYTGQTMDIDTRDGTIVIAGLTNVGNEIVIGALAPSYSVWSDLTINHRTDKDVTGIKVLY